MHLNGIEIMYYIFNFINVKNKIVYIITEEDIQMVAQKELERQLLPNEIDIIKNEIERHISWYDIIANAMAEKLIETQEL